MFKIKYLGNPYFKTRMQQIQRKSFIMSAKKYFLPDNFLEAEVDGVGFKIVMEQVGENDYVLNVIET